MKSEKVEFSNQKYLNDTERLQPFKLKMLDLISVKTPSRILDIGCGTGIISGMLKEQGWNVVGLDISFEGMKKYNRAGLMGLISNIEYALPFKSSVFDAIWMSEVIEHIVHYKILLREIKRVLKPKGRLYLTTPNSVFFGYRIMYLIGKCPTQLQHPYHVRFFSPKYLRQILETNGFSVEKYLGQNIYMLIPNRLISIITQLDSGLGKKFIKLIESIGFKKVEGLIHGEKYLLYNFSSFFSNFFSNDIMIVACVD